MTSVNVKSLLPGFRDAAASAASRVRRARSCHRDNRHAERVAGFPRLKGLDPRSAIARPEARTALRSTGARRRVVAEEASDGETGVALALRAQPDVVVMDLMMPRIDGLEATKRIKQVRPAVKVVVVTSFSVDDATRQEMYRSGVDALLGKRDVATALVPLISSVAQS